MFHIHSLTRILSLKVGCLSETKSNKKIFCCKLKKSKLIQNAVMVDLSVTLNLLQIARLNN